MGEASTTTAPNPPPPKRSPTSPNPPPRNEIFLWSRPTKVTTGRFPRPKAPPPHHHRRTAYEGRPHPRTHQSPHDGHHNPPPPPTKSDTPKGAEKKDDRPRDPIIGTVVHVPYPKGVERGTVRGIHGRKYGAVCVEYPGVTTLFQVSRSLLFPTPEEAERHMEEARAASQKKAKPPTPTNEASNPPNANPTTEPTNPTNPTNRTNPPSGPAKMWDPTTGSHEV